MIKYFIYIYFYLYLFLFLFIFLFIYCILSYLFLFFVNSQQMRCLLQICKIYRSVLTQVF